MYRTFIVLLPFVALCAADPYVENFDQLSEIPDTIMVLNGEFAIKPGDKGKVLEVEAEPLDTYSLLFGPTSTGNQIVRGRAKAESKGRRYPVYGYGLGGVTGVVLRLSGAKKALILVRNEQQIGSVEMAFPNDKWVWFHLQVRQTADEAWIAEGKAWIEGEDEPKDWLLSVPLDKAPVSGRASCWGIPYAGKPIQFDDFSVTELK